MQQRYCGICINTAPMYTSPGLPRSNMVWSLMFQIVLFTVVPSDPNIKSTLSGIWDSRIANCSLATRSLPFVCPIMYVCRWCTTILLSLHCQAVSLTDSLLSHHTVWNMAILNHRHFHKAFMKVETSCFQYEVSELGWPCKSHSHYCVSILTYFLYLNLAQSRQLTHIINSFCMKK